MSRKNLIIIAVLGVVVLITIMMTRQAQAATDTPKTIGNGPPPPPLIGGDFDMEILQHINLDRNTSPFQGGEFTGSGAGASFL